MWLLVVVFEIRKFEEVILMMPWLDSRKGLIQTRFPQIAARMNCQLMPGRQVPKKVGFELIRPNLARKTVHPAKKLG